MSERGDEKEAYEDTNDRGVSACVCVWVEIQEQCRKSPVQGRPCGYKCRHTFK